MGEGPAWVSRSGTFDAPLLVHEFPSELSFGFLGKILPATQTVELRLQMFPVASSIASELVHRAAVTAQAELESGDGAAGSRPARLEREAQSAQAVGAALAARQQELWRLGASFHGLGRNRMRAERARDRIRRNLEGFGFRVRVPRFESTLATAPPTLSGTERRPNDYWHLLPTDALAALFPLADELVAEPGGVLLGLLLDDATPLLLNRWTHASYSWAIFGATGSGKTFAAGLWALRSRWMSPSLDLIILDPLGEFSPLVRRLGGIVIPFRSAAVGRLNPLDPVTTAGDLDEKASRVTTMIGALFPSLLDEEAAQLDATLRRLLGGTGPPPTFSTLLEALPADGQRLPRLLEVFRSGSLRHLDGPTTLRWDASPVAFDFHDVPSHQLPFFLTFSLDAIAQRLRHRAGPKLIVVDEAHLLTRDPRTAEFLERMVRLVRHYDAGFLLLSQNPDDFLQTSSGQALARNLRLAAFLRVAHVSDETRNFFHLTEAEAEWLPRARLPREAGYSEGLIRAGASHFPVAVIASTPEYEFLASILGGGLPSAREEDAAPTARL